MEHCLPRTAVHGKPVFVEPGSGGGLCDEVEHSFRLVRRKLRDVTEAVDVALGQNEEVDVRLRIDVPDRDEALCPRDDGLSQGARDNPTELAAFGRVSRVGNYLTYSSGFTSRIQSSGSVTPVEWLGQ